MYCVFVSMSRCLLLVICSTSLSLSAPVAARSKAWVCGRLPAEIVVSNPTGGMDVCRECCVLSGRCLCDELIAHPEESDRLWCVVVCDLETGGCRAKNNQKALQIFWAVQRQLG
jgi:hypothetical protein